MRAIRWTVAVVAVVCTAATVAAASTFVLEGTEHLDVTTSYDRGELWDCSTAHVRGGSITEALVNDEAR